MKKNRKKAETYRFNGHPSFHARSIRPVPIVQLESRIADLQTKFADPNDPDDKNWVASWLKRYETELEKKRRGLALKEGERTDSYQSQQSPDETAPP